MTNIQEQKLIAALKDLVDFALLFGSHLDPKRVHAESDIDIAVYIPRDKDIADTARKLNDILFSLFDVDVDLVVLNDADLIITMQVLANGRLLVNNKPKEFIEYKAYKIGQYLDFKLARAYIERNIMRGFPNA